MKNVFKIILVIIGTIIGAGFASGKEIYIFFFKYGFNGLIGIVIASVLFSIIIYTINKISKKNQIENYGQLKINSQIKHIMNTFLTTSFYIMVAGFGAFVNQEFNIPYFIGVIILVFICYLTFKNESEGIIKVNTILVPALILIIMHTCYQNVENIIPKINFNTNNLNTSQISCNGGNIRNLIQNIMWLISCFEYVGYNSIILIPILIVIGKKVEPKQNLIVSIASGITFAILAFGIYIVLFQASKNELQLEIPIISIISKYGKIYRFLFLTVIAVSIYTTAISAGYGFLKSIAKTKQAYIKLIAILSISAIFISAIGFTQLVRILYPIFGILGIIQIILILKLKYNYHKTIEKKHKN